MKCPLKIHVVCFQDLFELSNKQTSKIDILYGEIRSGEEKITHACVCVCRGGGMCVLTIFYSPQTPMNRV